MAVFAIGAPTAHADATTTHRWVEVVVIGSEDDAHALDRSLRELLTRLEIDLDFRHVDHMTDSAFASGADTASRPLAVVAVDLDSDPVTVTFRDAQTGRALGKREIPRSGIPNVTVETVAQIVQVGVEDMTSQAPTPQSAVTATNPQSPPAPAPAMPTSTRVATSEGTPKRTHAKRSAGPSWGLDVGAFVDGNYVASTSGLVVGGGAETTFALWRGNLRPAIQLSGSYHAAFDQSDEFVSDRFKLLTMRAIPTLQLFGESVWSIDAGVGAGVDTWFSSATATTVPSNLLHGDRTNLDPVVVGLVAFHFSVAAGTNLFLAFALPVDVAPHRYLDDVGGTNEVLFEPARFRPAISFGFELTALGRVAYGPAAARNEGEK